MQYALVSREAKSLLMGKNNNNDNSQGEEEQQRPQQRRRQHPDRGRLAAQLATNFYVTGGAQGRPSFKAGGGTAGRRR